VNRKVKTQAPETKIGMVGCGAIADKHMEAFGAMDGVRPVVLVGRRPEPSRAFAEKWGFERFTLDLDDALDDAGVDAVVITSPNELHAPQAKRALQAGKHVLLEIPMALSAADAEQVAGLARQTDRRLMIAHTMRYFPAIQEVRRRTAAGELNIQHIVGFFGLLRRTNVTSAGQPRSWSDNLLWHFGAHMVDLALWTTGHTDARDVACRFGPVHPRQGVMDLSLAMTLPGGELVTLALSFNVRQFRWRAAFIGEQTTLDFDMGALAEAGGGGVVPPHSIVDLREQNAEFVAAVREGRDPAITAEDVLPAMRILQRAQACAETQAAPPCGQSGGVKIAMHEYPISNKEYPTDQGSGC